MCKTKWSLVIICASLLSIAVSDREYSGHDELPKNLIRRQQLFKYMEVINDSEKLKLSSHHDEDQYPHHSNDKLHPVPSLSPQQYNLHSLRCRNNVTLQPDGEPQQQYKEKFKRSDREIRQSSYYDSFKRYPSHHEGPPHYYNEHPFPPHHRHGPPFRHPYDPHDEHHPHPPHHRGHNRHHGPPHWHHHAGPPPRFMDDFPTPTPDFEDEIYENTPSTRPHAEEPPRRSDQAKTDDFSNNKPTQVHTTNTRGPKPIGNLNPDITTTEYEYMLDVRFGDGIDDQSTVHKISSLNETSTQLSPVTTKPMPTN